MKIKNKTRKPRVIPEGQKCKCRGCDKLAVTYFCHVFVCEECFKEKQLKIKEYNDLKNPVTNFKKYYDNYKQDAITRGQEWFKENREKLQKLPWKNKRKVMKLIDDYYLGNDGQNLIFEAYFNVVLIDILNLQGCDFVNQFPFQGRAFELQPRRVDGYCRKFNIPLETKCCYFGTNAQKELKNQIPEYLEFFKVKPLVISPEGFQDDTLDLYEGCKKVLKMIKAV